MSVPKYILCGLQTEQGGVMFLFSRTKSYICTFTSQVLSPPCFTSFLLFYDIQQLAIGTPLTTLEE